MLEKYLYFTCAGDMYRKYIPQEDYFSEGLYMFDIGQNDLAGEFYSKTEDQVIASIPTILLEFENGLKVCKNNGTFILAAFYDPFSKAVTNV
jgi:hypothetical protein